MRDDRRRPLAKVHDADTLGLTAEQIVAISSMFFAGLAGLLTAHGAIRSRRGAMSKEDEEET
ncbi:hypothetical protein [Roseomonas populi]|uniref:Uncharacterized protein n=1 Tax=Roseomonas populi TaxID=3121582 RepID=A0ABT1X0A2_9PROT|nr:hypothetical protein [Roseomonas pecuniae]MCR0980808.1 hypothetical protein [Roseomonas pecuniae]